MKQQERIRRPKPERTGPIRGGTFSLFGAPEAPPPDESGADGVNPTDPVARGVDLGYRVVDDYMRHGQNAARLIAERSYGPEALANDVQEVTASLMQYGAELMDLWMQLLGQAAVGQATRPGSDPVPFGQAMRPGSDPAPFGREPARTARPEAGASVPPRVIVAVESPYPTEVSVELDAGAGSSLLIQDLQNPAGGPPLIGVALEGGERPRLGVRVPPNQPPGTYCGLVLDAETSLPAGNVVVRVLPAPAPVSEQA